MMLNGMRYTKKFNLGNYESEEIGVDAAVNEGENPSQCLHVMMDFVRSKGAIPWPMGIGSPPPQQKQNVEAGEPVQLELTPQPQTEKVEPKKVEKKKTEEVEAKKPRRKPKEFAKTPEEKAQVKSPAIKSPGKSTVYNRSLDLHKKLVSELLDAKYPSWRATPNKALEASKSMEGVDFLDSEGIILESFKETFYSKMA